MNVLEKYGVDMSNLPVEDEQLRRIRDLCKETQTEKIVLPANRKEADMIIEKLEKLASK